MIIPIEYMSDFFVGPPLLDPNLSGSSSSGGAQRAGWHYRELRELQGLW